MAFSPKTITPACRSWGSASSAACASETLSPARFMESDTSSTSQAAFSPVPDSTLTPDSASTSSAVMAYRRAWDSFAFRPLPGCSRHSA